MSEVSAPTMSRPTSEHALLAQQIGKWKVSCKFYMDPTQPPMETEATEVVEAVGPFWTLSKFESKFEGKPFVGRGTMGYEPHTRQYVSIWIDSMMPVLSVFRGTQQGDTLTMTGDAFHPAANAVLKHRTTEKHIGKDERIFEMFLTMPDGKETKVMSNHYRRA